MAAFDSLGEDYLRLAFAINQHIDGYVDAYTGPAQLREQAASRAPLPPTELVAQADALLRAINDSDYGPRRRSYLTKQAIAMQTTCRTLAGEAFAYADEVERFFDIQPTHIPEDVFDAAIEELETLLPGNGPVHERMNAWRTQFEVTPEIGRQLLEVIEHELKQRTLALYPLPPEEKVEFRFVQNQPWSGYNWYYGAYRSGVDINTDLPIQANQLPFLIAHEAYPGHHTEHCIKEASLQNQRGWAEHSIFLLNTPECVIAEGIANVGISILFAPDELERWKNEQLYPLAGIESNPEVERRINQATQALRGVGGNAALLIHAAGRSEADVRAYLMRYGLNTEERAHQRLKFITAPLWRAYIFTYFYGEDLMRQWLDRGDKTERYGTLLREQIYPSLLEQWVLDDRAACGL